MEEIVNVDCIVFSCLGMIIVRIDVIMKCIVVLVIRSFFFDYDLGRSYGFF